MSCFHLLPTVSLQSKIKSIECCYIILPLIYLIIATFGTISQFISIATDYKSILSPYSAIANDINISLIQRPITDLQVANVSEWYCPQGYTPLNMSYWPGNEPGCYDHGEIFHSTGCNVHGHNDSLNTGKNIVSNPKMLLYFWGTYKFCARYDHYLPINSSTLECPQGYKTCSKSGLCAVQASQCPVTSVSVNWKHNGWNSSMVLSLDVTNDPNKEPIIGVSTSVNGLPCLNPTLRPILEDAPVYKLEQEKPKGCDKFGANQDTMQGIDQESLLQFYTENKLEEYISKLPGYSDDLKKSTAVLYTRSQVEVNSSPECQNILYLMRTIGANINDFTFSTGIMTTLIAYDVIVVIFGFVMFFYLYVDKENEERDKYFREQKCLFHSFHFVPYILCVFSIAQFSQIPENGGQMASTLLDVASTIINNQCFTQSQYSNVFVELQNDVIECTEDFFGSTWTMGIISYIFMVLMLGLRGLRGYYMSEVKEFENKYLEDRFTLTNRSQADTEMSIQPVESNQQVEPQEYYEEVDYTNIVFRL